MMLLQNDRTLVVVAYALISIFLGSVTAIPTISIKGSKFFTSEGDQFYIKGIAYESDGRSTNNLSNGPKCEADAKLLKELGANTIRVYAVDPTIDHDRCMKAFDDAGIYVMVDMTTPEIYIDRLEPDWNITLRDEFAKVLDGFAEYDNLLGFFAGNEVVVGEESTVSAKYVKASIADMKAYRDMMKYRKIPIGYSTPDSAEIRENLKKYFACGDDNSTHADFIGLNFYRWCGDSSFEISGYDQIYEEIDGYSLPIFFSESGCVVESTSGGRAIRNFSDQPSIYGRNMNDRLSGNMIYEWGDHANGYGIVEYENKEPDSGRVTLLGDYTRLSSQWATLTPAGVKASEYDPTLTAPSCPEFTSETWLLEANEALPTLGLSGFTAPSGTRTDAAAAPTSPSSGEESGGRKSNGVGVGGFVGIAVGVVVGVALLVWGFWYFVIVRRRRRQHEAVPTSPRSEEKLHYDDSGQYHGLQELPPNATAHELDPSKGHHVVMKATELPPKHGVGELRGVPLNEMESDHINRESAGFAQSQEVHQRDDTISPAQSSPYVEAQRRMEMEWLESEEARLRQRREVLQNQHQR